jgi:uncharacterized protein YbbC (DUF1343 family)
MAEDLRVWLKRAVALSKAPGATACVGRAGDKGLFLAAEGLRQITPVTEAATEDTLYDLASLTKQISTTTSVMLLHEDGKLNLDQKVSEFLPLPGLEQYTLRQCITHTAGLAPFKPWHTDIHSPEEIVQRIADLPPAHPAGTQRVYSDLGFILLAQVVGQAAREPIDAFIARRVFKPLGMKRTLFNPGPELRKDCAATENCPWRKRVLKGEVHDERAFAMGGVAGHAGLFGTAPDLGLFCDALLSGKILKHPTLDEILKMGQVPFYPGQGLGWWLDPWTSGSNGYLPSRHAFGHTGFTGTSMWLDRDTGIYAVLLSNTVHPRRDPRDNASLRRTFYDGVMFAHYLKSTNAHSGIDYMPRVDYEAVRGKRAAILTNQAATDMLGRPDLEAFGLEPGVTFKTIYTPEHGLRGQAEAGKAVASEKTGATPAISLYGKQKRPTKDELKGVQLFVIDLPDVGSRYYTYMATMKECLAACAESGVPVLVLDRPNPLGGTVLEGPIAKVYESAVCSAPIPARHGMTLGEIATFLQQTVFAKSRLKLEIQNAENWRRELMHPVCALPWTPPSPNLPTFETALAYAGTCLFEGVNLNEGRGTDTPFLLFGAPWMDSKAVVDAVDPALAAGFTLTPKVYIPKPIPGKAENPEHDGKPCKGVRLEVADPDAARPFSLAVAVLAELVKRHRDQLQWKPNFDTLAGGPWLREQIMAGRPAADIISETAAELAAFDAVRPKRYATTAEMLQGYLKADQRS